MARRPVLLSAGLLSAAALTAAALPSTAATPLSDHLLRPPAGPDSGTFPGAEAPLGDVDRRGPALAPLASARAAVAALGDDVRVSWTPYGTAKTLTRPGGWLATGLAGSPVEVAKGFLRERAGLLGLTAADVDALEVVYDTPLSGQEEARAVLLRQRVDGIALAEDGLVTVGVRGDRVASVTSSAVGRQALNTTAPTLSAVQGVLAAARDAGMSTLRLEDLELGAVDSAGFTLVTATDLAQPQRARLRALPTTDRGLRLVWETAVQDVAGGRALAAMSFVDAVTGDVLLRRDAVDTAAAGLPVAQAAPSGGQLSGTYSADACSDPQPLTVPEGTASITIAVTAVNPANDITFRVDRNGEPILDQDLLTTPEAAQASVDPPATADDEFTVSVCPFDDTVTAPFDFVGGYVTSETAAGTGGLPGLPNLPLPNDLLFGPPTWRAFGSNPTLPTGPGASPDDRQLVCGTVPGATGSKDLTECDVLTGDDASPLPYDVEATTGLPTFATIGNNAITTNAQLSTSLTPGPPAVPFASPTRDYAPPFTDAWHTSSCDPTQTVGRADVDAAIVNLFVGHNLAHDFTYRLGLTEQTGALQVNNFGKGGAEGDAELGNTQNAAATNAAFSVTNEVTTPAAGLGLTGRNNANQITLQDGVPGITNQYLFEPILGFYGPCTDGDLDSSIFLHEYTHAVSNRLVAGPDTGLGGEQAGAMGESWSDLVAVEYLQAFGLAGDRGEDPYSVGAYATGDPQEGIRDFNLRPDKNPLNYSSYGFDSTGPEVHADGEIWNAVQMTVREALIEAYESRFPFGDEALQEACALGFTPDGAAAPTFDGCPGNRRWVTYLLDAMLLQANGSPTFVDMKDATLAAVTMRGGADLQVVSDAFASRGLGADSSAVDVEDTDPTPGFASPTAGRNADVTFSLVDDATGAPVAGSVYVGRYQARATPVATTLGGEAPDASAPLVAGTYDFLVQAPGYGGQRFTRDLAAGPQTQVFRLLPNVASAAQGATARGEGLVRPEQLIDSDEATNGGFDGTADDVPVAGRTVTVDLAGGVNRVTAVAVSALHHPVDAEDTTDFQGRLLGLRAFDLQASTDGGKTFTTVYSSPADFFPADRPRATAPDLDLRTVQLPQPVLADTLRLVVRSSQCTGAPDFNGVQKAALAQELNGASACAFNNDDDTDPSGQDAERTPDTSSAESQRVLITELQAFGTAASLVGGPTTPVAAPSTGRLPATGAPTWAAGLGLLLLAGAGAALRRRAA